MIAKAILKMTQVNQAISAFSRLIEVTMMTPAKARTIMMMETMSMTLDLLSFALKVARFFSISSSMEMVPS